jgi:hypothetical protein
MNFVIVARPYTVWAQEFSMEVISAEVVLLRYKSAHLTECGNLQQHPWRTSLWQYTDKGWRRRFQQVALTDSIEKQSN